MTRQDFLKLMGAVGFSLVLAVLALAAEDERAQHVIHSQGCRGCHQIGGSGGTLGPGLNQVGKRLTPEQLRQRLLNPKASNPASMMPSYGHLPAEDLQALVEYLAGLK